MIADDSNGLLDASAVRQLLQAVGTEIGRRKQRADITVYGGSALLLHGNQRSATHDIDYVSTGGSEVALLEAAGIVGRENDLPANWFNDAVRMFCSDRPEQIHLQRFPAGAGNGLRVDLATPRYILAMKMLAMRSSLETNDLRDIWSLLDICAIGSIEAAEGLIYRFYPDIELPQRHKDILQDVLEAKCAGARYDPMMGW